MQITLTPYTAECVTVLFDEVKEELHKQKIDPGALKYLIATNSIIEEVVIKIKKKLVEPNPNENNLKFKLNSYQEYFFARFLFENRNKFQNQLEQTLLYNLAQSIDTKEKNNKK